MGLDLPAEPKLFVIKRWVSGMVCHQALKLQTNWKLFQQSLEVKDLEAIMQAFEKMLHSCLRDCFFLDVCKQDSFWLNQSWPESSSSLAWASQFLQRDCRALREKFKRCFDRRNHRKDQRVHEDFTREGAKWPAHISQINSYFQGFLFYPYFTYSHCPIYFNDVLFLRLRKLFLFVRLSRPGTPYIFGISRKF